MTKMVRVVMTFSLLMSLPEVDVFIAIKTNGDPRTWEPLLDIGMHNTLDHLSRHKRDLIVSQLDIELGSREHFSLLLQGGLVVCSHLST